MDPMNANGNMRKRPDLWSYISFSRPSSRRASVTLPTHDSFEKPDRAFSRSRGFSGMDSAYSAQHQSQRSRYLKLGGIVGIVILLLYFLSPGQYVRRPFSGGQTASHPSAATTKCTTSYHPSKPLIQYALMIDAGSTGSRIHVYRFNNCGSTPELENEVFEMTPKREGGSGLSSYGSDAEGAARSLDHLMDVAVASVPQSYRSCSPVSVKATAGLRKLGKEKSQNTLQAVKSRLETVYPFPVVASQIIDGELRGGIEVMEGTDEGVYAWITTNFLLGNIGGPDKTPTAAVFDLGGGSTQIVFEPTFPDAREGGMAETLAEGDHKYSLTFGGREFTLYQHSYLGYGLMAAREALHKVVVAAAKSNNQAWQSEPIINPCIAPGMTRKVEIENEILGGGVEKVAVTMAGPETGSAAQCRALAEKTLNKEAPCTLSPCAFNGVHQPSLSKVFSREDIYLFSYFFDRTQPLGMPESFTLEELKDVTAKVCDGEPAWAGFASTPDALSELRERPEHCLDLNFMLALLHTGYEMPMEREVRIAKKIKDRELGWCLGASLPLLEKESGWQCRIKEIS